MALDYYAQADDGSVWYFGEDVADYDTAGTIAFTTDSWLAGQDGPPAMIMPSHPTVGEAFRTENIPGLVFEEVTVKSTDQTVPGAGAVQGAMVGEELHDDGKRSDKVFAPGYGEFLTRDTDGVEAMALAVPTDALDTPTPAALDALATAADSAFGAVQSEDWSGASTALREAATAWGRYRQTSAAPPRLQPPISRALRAPAAAVTARDRERGCTAAIDVSQAALDLELRYRPPAEIDRARFEQWTRQLIVDTQAEDLGGVTGDLASLEWTRDRFADLLSGADLALINASLLALRGSQVDGDLQAVGSEAANLREALNGIQLETSPGSSPRSDAVGH